MQVIWATVAATEVDENISSISSGEVFIPLTASSLSGVTRDTVSPCTAGDDRGRPQVMAREGLVPFTSHVCLCDHDTINSYIFTLLMTTEPEFPGNLRDSNVPSSETRGETHTRND